MASLPKATSARDIQSALSAITPVTKSLPGYEGKVLSRYSEGVCMDECFPGLYIGDLGAAMNKEYLRKVGITHVVNTAEGNKFSAVDTSPEYYKGTVIKYIGMSLLDSPYVNISQYFDKGAEFIDEGLSCGGKVLVHCYMGISRSATIACAFLMLKRNMTAVEAIQQLRQSRSVYPNEGFLAQLAELDNKLRTERGSL